MKEVIEKIKSADPKMLIIYSIMILGIIISIFMFSSSDDETLDVNKVNITEQEKSVYTTKKEALKAKYGEDQSNSTSYKEAAANKDISEITDDPDAAALYETQERIRQSNLAQQQQQEYAPKQSQSAQVTALRQVAQYPNKEEIISTPQEPIKEEVQEPEEPKKKKGNRFYEGKRRERKGNTFACVVHGDQEVMNGSTLKIRLLDEYTTSTGVLLQKGTTLWGVCSLTKDRMNVSIQSVLKGKDLVDLNFIVYDIDGLKGINLPNNVKAEIAKRTKQQALQEAPTDELIGNDGILEKTGKTIVNTTKNILSKKQGEIKILVKSNYQLVLKPL